MLRPELYDVAPVGGSGELGCGRLLPGAHAPSSMMSPPLGARGSWINT